MRMTSLLRSLRFSAMAFLAATLYANAGTVWLDDVDLTKTTQDWGQPHKNQSVDGHPLSIGGQKFDHGLGTHAASTLHIDLKGAAKSFTAKVGVDDEEKDKPSSVKFSVIGDGKILWKSGIMKAGQSPESADVNLSGITNLVLQVDPAVADISFDHADWADARFETVETAAAQPLAVEAPREEAVILTPKPPPTPRINSPHIFGVRPGHPVLFTIAATGERPMKFSASGLPNGLALDSQTGRITGSVAKKGEYVATLNARNKLGSAKIKWRLEVGDKIALTPPMGWNSWNCFAGAVDDGKIRSAADAMVASGLADHGWTYINIDDFWQVHRDSKDPTLQGPHRDSQGRILPNPRFPDMKALAEYVHGKGLRIGLYSSPGPWTCGGCVASFDHEMLDAQQYAAWGFDYLKYDWCSYNPKMESQRTISKSLAAADSWTATVPKDRIQFMRPYAIMHDALMAQPRDIVYSLCQYGMGDVWEWGAQVGGNCWRTTGDITDTWGSMSGIGFGQAGHEKYGGPGHWNDPDMLVVGRLGWGKLRPTRLTPNEQYTHISLWCLLSAPLLIGCDLSQLDEFTLNLLSNDEVIEVSQDPLGQQAARLSRSDTTEIWGKQMEDGSKAVGLFNRGEGETTITADWKTLGLSGKHRVRDLWRQRDLGTFDDSFQVTVPRHGVVLVRIWQQ